MKQYFNKKIIYNKIQAMKFINCEANLYDVFINHDTDKIAFVFEDDEKYKILFDLWCRHQLD